MILLLGGEKGGTGKSTVAVNLAVWLVHQGADVILVDTDLQRTASHFIDRRNEITDARKIHCAEKHGNVFETVRDLANSYEQVIVDAGGRDSEELRTSMVASQVIYCPLKASQPDIETSIHMNELVKLARGMNPALQARLLISMGPTNPVIHEADEAREILVDLTEFSLSTVTIGDRKVYRDSMIEGRGVIEMGNAKAKAEIETLAAEIYGENQ